MVSEKISVIMGIYNCEKTLIEAVQSIQNQTYTNWELIMCDDGSTDSTYAAAKRIADNDSRIILIKNDKNVGLNKTLNNCLAYASGDYIARMDGDDVCLPERFEKQISYLKSQQNYAICSSSMYFFDENGEWGRNHVIPYPTKEQIVSQSPICHAPVMMRRECMTKVNGYTEDVRMLRVEDVNLWIKLYAAGYRCHNLPEALYGMRNDKDAMNRRKFKYRINESYVRLKGCCLLHLKFRYYILALKPILVGMIPARIRFFIRKRQWSK